MGDSTSTNKKAGGGGQGSNQNNNTVTPNPNDVSTATNTIQSNIGFNQTNHPSEGIVNSYAFTPEGQQTHMYGGTLSTATNQYLVDIGEAVQTGGGGYMLTSKGWAIKYGSYTAGQTQTGGAVGTGASGGVMGSTPLSEEMFESQNKTKNIMLGALSVFSPFPVSSVLAAGSADALNQKGKYGDYRKSFTANMAMGSVDQSSQQTENPKTANLAMGDTIQTTNNNKKKSKTTKKTGTFFAGYGMDEASNKREFFV